MHDGPVPRTEQHADRLDSSSLFFVKVYNRTSLVHSRLTVNGHIKPAERLRFVDRYLVTGGRDGMAKVWAM